MENEFEIGQKVYYKTIFGHLKPVKLIDKRKVRTINNYGAPIYSMEYALEFPNKKIKIVGRERIF